MAHFVGNIEVAQINWASALKSGTAASAKGHSTAFVGNIDVAQINWASALKSGTVASGKGHSQAFAGNNLFSDLSFKVK
jgi:hypothetical protein